MTITLKFEKLVDKMKARELSALTLLIAGIIMAFLALFMPPPGEIHESVLYIFAQILIYAGSVFCIDAYIKKLMDERKKNGEP